MSSGEGMRLEGEAARRMTDQIAKEKREQLGEARTRGPFKAEERYSLFFEEGEDGWWVASCPQVKGALSQGRTLDEARSNILDAMSLVLEPPGMRMSLGELKEKVRAINEDEEMVIDCAKAHFDIDHLMLEYIGDQELKQLYEAQHKWYS